MFVTHTLVTIVLALTCTMLACVLASFIWLSSRIGTCHLLHRRRNLTVTSTTPSGPPLHAIRSYRISSVHNYPDCKGMRVDVESFDGRPFTVDVSALLARAVSEGNMHVYMIAANNIFVVNDVIAAEATGTGYSHVVISPAEGIITPISLASSSLSLCAPPNDDAQTDAVTGHQAGHLVWIYVA